MPTTLCFATFHCQCINAEFSKISLYSSTIHSILFHETSNLLYYLTPLGLYQQNVNSENSSPLLLLSIQYTVNVKSIGKEYLIIKRRFFASILYHIKSKESWEVLEERLNTTCLLELWMETSTDLYCITQYTNKTMRYWKWNNQEKRMDVIMGKEGTTTANAHAHGSYLAHCMVYVEMNIVFLMDEYGQWEWRNITQNNIIKTGNLWKNPVHIHKVVTVSTKIIVFTQTCIQTMNVHGELLWTWPYAPNRIEVLTGWKNDEGTVVVPCRLVTGKMWLQNVEGDQELMNVEHVYDNKISLKEKISELETMEDRQLQHTTRHSELRSSLLVVQNAVQIMSHCTLPQDWKQLLTFTVDTILLPPSTFTSTNWTVYIQIHKNTSFFPTRLSLEGWTLWCSFTQGPLSESVSLRVPSTFGSDDNGWTFDIPLPHFTENLPLNGKAALCFPGNTPKHIWSKSIPTWCSTRKIPHMPQHLFRLPLPRENKKKKISRSTIEEWMSSQYNNEFKRLGPTQWTINLMPIETSLEDNESLVPSLEELLPTALGCMADLIPLRWKRQEIKQGTTRFGFLLPSGHSVVLESVWKDPYLQVGIYTTQESDLYLLRSDLLNVLAQRAAPFFVLKNAASLDSFQGVHALSRWAPQLWMDLEEKITRLYTTWKSIPGNGKEVQVQFKELMTVCLESLKLYKTLRENASNQSGLLVYNKM